MPLFDELAWVQPVKSATSPMVMEMNKYGFELLEEQTLSEVGGTARLWQHAKTGAQLLSVLNKDENKCFGVSFYTPPTDSTGVSHILEHSVLGGSQKYPVKEPFAELLKGSLQTFLNAFTFPDKTCYPVASANLQDFYNLIDVYLDAVFHPLLSENTFRQEGWHIEADTADGPWVFKGVVYNEMKGVYSSADSVLAEQSQQAVFPDNLYSLDSGGNPEHIPDLTYQAFRDFHSRYYQPGNARFFFWGDDPEDWRLKRIDQEIAAYGTISSLPDITSQKQPQQNVYVEKLYAAGEDENRAFVTLNWLFPPARDPRESIQLEMLEHILQGMPGSPLRRALMESGLGEAVTGCGLETDLRQMYYSTGLKGIKEADAGKVETLVLETIARLAKDGIDPAAIEAAVNTVEFAYREANTGRFPRGLSAMLLALSSWLYKGNPLAMLAWEKPIAAIKADLKSGKKIFEELLTSHFLNAHYTRVTLLPDSSLAKIRIASEEGRLYEIQAQTSSAGRMKLVEETAQLKKAQMAPDSPEALAKIPALSVKDLPKHTQPIPTIITREDSSIFLVHDLPTRGVAYCNLLLPIDKIPDELVPMLPLFARSLTETGSASCDYTELGRRIAAKTGGVSASILTSAKLGSREPYCYLALTGKAVYEKISDLFGLFQEILLTPQTDKAVLRKRLALMCSEARSNLEYVLQVAGNMAVNLRLGAHFTGDAALAEKLFGISQLECLRGLESAFAVKPEVVLANLEEIRSLAIASQNSIFSCVAEQAQLDSLCAQAKALFAQIPARVQDAGGIKIKAYPAMSQLPPSEAFLTEGQVNFVGKGANLYDLGYSFSGSARVIMRWLKMGRLWEEIRVSGGAYGASCSLDRISGNMGCSSYRDPNVDRTLDVYNGLATWLRTAPPDQHQIDQAIVGAVGDVDAYQLPDARGQQALGWYLEGIDAEMRQKTREEMLATTVEDFTQFADVLDAFAQNGDICVLGGTKAAKAAEEHGWKTEQLIRNVS